jgi:GNAT superfamily N-acetyltransferase
MLAIRAMLPSDVVGAHAIRLRVRENQLSDPSVVTEQDYHDFMARDTMSWVCEVNGAMAGFVMVDVEKRNLWALFMAPEHEFKGAGRALHEVMLTWYFTKADRLRLSTAPNTRAAAFYRKAGYRDMGPTNDGRELIFELHRTTAEQR